jgi:arginine-tRNA-protein transferase
VNEERLDLYHRFHEDRHRRRGWPAPSIDPLEYFGAFADNAVSTLEFRYRLHGRLVAVAYVDESPEALNSIYAFSDPGLARRSLGTNDVLLEIEAARARGKEHLYLGYTVAGCPSMAYKRLFRPHEILRDGRWVRLDA